MGADRERKKDQHWERAKGRQQEQTGRASGDENSICLN